MKNLLLFKIKVITILTTKIVLAHGSTEVWRKPTEITGFHSSPACRPYIGHWSRWNYLKLSQSIPNWRKWLETSQILTQLTRNGSKLRESRQWWPDYTAPMLWSVFFIAVSKRRGQLQHVIHIIKTKYLKYLTFIVYCRLECVLTFIYPETLVLGDDFVRYNPL